MIARSALRFFQGTPRSSSSAAAASDGLNRFATRSVWTGAGKKKRRENLKRNHAKRVQDLAGGIRPVYAPGDAVFDFVSLEDGVVEEADHIDKWVKLVDGATLINIADIGLIDPSTGIPTLPDDIRIRAHEDGTAVRVFQKSGHELAFPDGHEIKYPESRKPKKIEDEVSEEDKSKVFKLDTKPADVLEVTYDPGERLHPDLLYINAKSNKSKMIHKARKREAKEYKEGRRQEKEERKERRREHKAEGRSDTIEAYIERTANNMY